MSSYDSRFGRNALNQNQQTTIRQTAFVLIGLGGIGGFIFENLLRMGAENIHVFEHDIVDHSNFNRQLLATDSSFGKSKSEAALARARIINPDAKITVSGAFETAASLDDSDIVLDGSDNLQTRLTACSKSYALELPYVFSSAQDWRGIVSVFDSYPMENAFQATDSMISKNQGQPRKVACPAAALSASLAVSQAVNLLLQKHYVRAPQALFFDLSRNDMFWKADLG